MREIAIRVHSVQDVQDFVSIATKFPCTVLVGDGHHRVNGKSFMEMFCLDLSQPLTVAVDCSEEEWECFRQEMSRFPV